VIWILAASVFILINWQVYVIGVNSHQVVETALGYFINPLVTTLLAVVFLGERLNRLQWAAVAFGFAAVALLTYDYGRPPWIALTLASSFGLYGLAKNKLGGVVSGLNSFALESGFLLPLAIVQALVVASLNHGLSFGAIGFWGSAGLVFFGFMTAIPLIMFGAAAKHVPLRYIGFMQYLTPVLQFTIAITVFGEPMPAVRWVGFGLVWIGLVLLSTDMIRTTRANRAKNA
jgi:chloramphenicol-sensitive protein RarD